MTSKNWLIVDMKDHGTSYLLESMKSNNDVEILSLEDLKKNSNIIFDENDKVCVTSETTLSTVLERLKNIKHRDSILLMKDKEKCREYLLNLYPEFYYKKLPLDQIRNCNFHSDKKYVLKPVKGYSGTAVRIIEGSENIDEVIEDMRAELEKNRAFFSNSVLSEDEFLIEEFIPGEEYAVDMYYSENGQPEILNIYHHPIPEKFEYLHTLYYTSLDVFNKLHDQLICFFTEFNKKLNLKSFPVHGEFKYDGKKIVPVELNPLRYGGDGLADLTYYGFSKNPFLIYFKNKKMDWKNIWNKRKKKIYAWILGYNGAGLEISNLRPHLSKYRSMFSNVITDLPLNYKKHIGFSVMYIEEEDINRINKLVNTDFSEYFIGSQEYSKKSYDAMYRSGMKMYIQKDNYLWEQGDVGDYLYLIMEGVVDIIGESDNGDTVSFAHVGQGCVIGELTALDGLPRSASVKTVTDCELLKITGSAFRELVHTVPELLEDLYWQQVDRLRNLSKKLTDLNAEKSKELNMIFDGEQK